jgi:1-acyl-sn-glycerol-3-phosphate acyltransferase
MKSITLAWFRNIERRPLLYFITFIILLCLILFLAKTRLQIEEDMQSSMPESIKLELLKKISERQKTNQLVGIQFLGTSESRKSQLKYVDSCLLKNDFLDTSIQKDINLESAINPLLSSVPAFLKPSDYSEFKNALSDSGSVKQFEQIMNQLYSPESMVNAELIFKDPFNTLEMSINNIVNGFGGSNLLQSFTNQDESGVKMYHLNFESNEIDQGRIIEDYLNDCFDNLNVKDRPVHFGYYQIALANADQIKQDTFYTIGIAGILTLILLLLYYRKISVVLLFGLPVVFAIGFALASFAVIGRPISGISIGMGAVVIGIILDFSFHFYTHFRTSNSVQETLHSISTPLALGALTTILAFGALFFTNSKAMQDFGLFASLTIFGAAFFTLFILPILIKFFRISYKTMGAPKDLKLPKLGGKVRMFITVSIIGSTILMGYFASNISFSSDLESINFFPEELRNNEAQVLGMDSRTTRAVFAFAKGKTLDDTYALNEKVLGYLDSIHKIDTNFSYLSTAIINPSKRKIKDCFSTWNSFWRSNEEKLNRFDSLSITAGFTPNAFAEFRELTNTLPSYLAIDSIARLFPVNFEFEEDSAIKIASLIEYPLDKYDEYLGALAAIPGVELISKKELATDLVTALEADFNYILFISIFIVIVAMWMAYGRIELVIITFLPMAISWIWILGFSYLFGIEFNFINIIVCTFIFGLGDDYAIFITDGYLQEYREGRKELPAFKNAILLSALTTIIGCGSLFFAEHPALNSIAPMAVLGMVIIVISSFLIQPWLFEILILKPTKKNKPPLTLVGIVASIFAFSYFFIGCTILFILLGVFLLIPISKKLKVKAYNWVISKFTLTLLYVMMNFRKKIIGRENLDKQTPSVIISNHQSFVDILAIVLLHPKIKLLTNDWVYNSIVFGWAVRYAGYVTADHGTEANLKVIRQMTNEGYSIAVFPEGTRSKDGKIGRFHKGAFMIADELKLPIVPVILHGFDYVMSKHDYVLKNGRLTTKILPPIMPNDESYGVGYKERTKSITAYFKEQYYEHQKETEDAKYFYQRIKSNYDYRGPIVEFYFKIKWLFERDNYDYYSQFITNEDRLLDAGCGYGYYSFFLHYKYPELKIDAMDMDKLKIANAHNGTAKSDKLNFFSGDIRDLDYEGYTKIFFNDVLHYLTEADLNKLVDRIFSKLKTTQAVFIRDGNEDDGDNHKTTKLTEVFSTVSGFNQTTNDLFFFGETWLENKAKEHQLHFEMVEQDSRTSNVMYIVKCQK